MQQIHFGDWSRPIIPRTDRFTVVCVAVDGCGRPHIHCKAVTSIGCDRDASSHAPPPVTGHRRRGSFDVSARTAALRGERLGVSTGSYRVMVMV